MVNLISRTIETAMRSNIFDQIIITTDDPDAIDIAKKYPVNILKRPKTLLYKIRF